MPAVDKKASELTAPVSIADTDVFAGYRPGTGGEPNLDIKAAVGLVRTIPASGLATDSVARPIAARLAEQISVKDFGATGDGTTVDTTAIQAAITAAAALNVECFFPGGTYIVGALTVPTGCRLRGSGIEKTYLRRTTDVTILSAIGTAAPVGASDHYGFTMSDMSLRNLAPGSTSPVIKLWGAGAVFFERVRIQSFSDGSPLLDCMQVWDSKFTNCMFHGGGSVTGAVGAVRLRAGTDGYKQTKETFFVNCWWESYFGPAIEASRPGGYTTTKCEQLHFTNCKLESQLCSTAHVVLTANSCNFTSFYISFKLTAGPIVDLVDAKGTEGAIGFYYIAGATVPSALLNVSASSWYAKLLLKVMVASQPTDANLVTLATPTDDRNDITITGETQTLINGALSTNARYATREMAFDKRRMLYLRSATVPAGMGWDHTNYPVSPSITETLNGQVWGDAGITPEAMFDRVSTARSAPAATYYVSTAGSNANNGLTWGTAVRSLYKAQDLVNAGNVPATVFVEYSAAGYERGNSFPGGSTTSATVDTAWVAVDGGVRGGRQVSTGVWDTVTGFTADATHTNTYSKSVANCERVLDRLVFDEFGNNAEMVQCATAAACNVRPNSWACVSSVLYINRADGAAPTDTNTRYFRNAALYQILGQFNVYMEGFDLQGSANNYSVFHVNSSAVAAPGSPCAIVCKNTSARYGGGFVGTSGGRGFGIVNWYGLLGFWNCQSDANAGDAYGAHNGLSGAVLQLTVNCRGMNNGRGIQSVNGLTAHENGLMIDIAGRYVKNRGGNIHCIDQSKTYLLGTVSENDLGDAAAGGGIPAVGVRAVGTAQIWCERVRVNQPPGTLAYNATNTAQIHRRDCAPVPQADFGSGTFDTF